MAVEEWIDEIAALAGTVDNGKGGKVLSYSVFRRAEFPESLSTFPCALTYTSEVRSTYSLGGPNIDLWYGITEFHLVPNIAKSHYPFIMRFFARIKAAFAVHMTLGGKVAYCQLRTDEPGLQGPVTLQYGSEDPHLGIVARWMVKEDTTGEFTVGV
jgi:hypothetical protein